MFLVFVSNEILSLNIYVPNILYRDEPYLKPFSTKYDIITIESTVQRTHCLRLFLVHKVAESCPYTWSAVYGPHSTCVYWYNLWDL